MLRFIYCTLEMKIDQLSLNFNNDITKLVWIMCTYIDNNI